MNKMSLLDERINLLLKEFERVPTPEEVEEVYLSHYSSLADALKEARELISSLRDPTFRNSLEARIIEEEHPITIEQEKAAIKLYQKRRAILPYGTGSGKTHVSLAVAKMISLAQGNDELKTVIISPKANDLKPQWAHRIQKYSQHPDKEKIVVINNLPDSLPNGIPVLWDRNDPNSKTLINNSDFIIINYHMVPKWMDLLPRQAYGIIDEAHNIGDGDVIAPRVKELVRDYEYLALLTASPMPNNIRSVESLVNLISREPFKIPRSSQSFTQIVRNKLRQFFIWPSYSLEDNLFTSDGRKVNVNDVDIPVNLEGEHGEFYKRVFEARTDEHDMVKLIALREAALDPSLIFLPKGRNGELNTLNQFAGSLFPIAPIIESSVYRRLIELGQDIFNKGEKMVVYSEFVTGVLDKLGHYFENAGIPAIVVDGKNAGLKRKLFQIEPTICAAIGSYSISEGASYAAANHGVFLTPPYEDLRYIQGRGRLVRPGQENDQVNLYHFYTASTVTEGILTQTRTKGKSIRAVLSGAEVSEQDIDELLQDKPVESVSIAGYINPLYDKDILRTIVGLLSQVDCSNLEKILEEEIRLPGKVSGKIGEIFTELHNSNFESSYQANVARVYAQILGNFNLDKILDAAGGAAIASRILGVPTTVVDINRYQIEAGKKACEELNIKNTYIHGSIQATELGEEKFDTVVYSLGFHWGTKKDRVRILRNLNKALVKDGVLILTLPKNKASSENAASIEEGIEKLGYEVLPEYTGNVVSPENYRFGVYVLTARKVEYVSKRVNMNYFKLASNKKGLKITSTEGESIENILIKDILRNRKDDNQKRETLYSFSFDDGRLIGTNEKISSSLLEVLEKTPYNQVEGAARRFSNVYDPRILYQACELLVDSVDKVSVDTYKKIERMFDIISDKAFPVKK